MEHGLPGSSDTTVVALLGPVQVVTGGVVAPVRQRGLLALLAVLALSANQVVPAAALIEALWQEQPSRSRERNLHARVHQLRSRLQWHESGPGPRLVTRQPGYLLALDGHRLDVQDFSQLAASGRELLRAGHPAAAATEFGRALALWRGPALADLAGISPQLDGMAAALDEQRMATIESQAEAELATGEAASVAARLRPLVAAYPLRERLRWQLMLALQRTGRQAEALEFYTEAEQILAEELGIDPGPDLRDLQSRIRRADPSLAWRQPAHGTAGRAGMVPPEAAARAVRAVPRQLPAPPTPFAGRGAELAALDGLLARGSAAPGTVAITAVCGTGGVGKTTLALHWARQVADQFADGQLHVNLRGHDPLGPPVAPDEVIRQFLEALGVPPEEIPAAAEARAALYRSLAAGLRLLIVLDNARDAEQVRPLLPASPDSLVLVTSRAELAGLSVTEGASLLRLDLLTAPDAADLLAGWLGRSRLAAEPGAAAQIITGCARLPLALTIAAARAAAAPDLSLTTLAAGLSGELSRLDTLRPGPEGEPADGVRAVFSWSLRQVTEPAARLFRLIGLHPGPDISAAAAASLAGTDLRRVRQPLRELTAASLLTERLPGRFACHDLLRAYAAELAGQTDSPAERRAAVHRVLDHYLYSAEHATAQIRGQNRPAPVPLPGPAAGVFAETADGRDAVFAWFGREVRVLLAATSWAAAHDFTSHSWQLAWQLGQYFFRHGYLPEYLPACQAALEAASRDGDHLATGLMHAQLGQACYYGGTLEQAAAHYEQAAREYQISGDTFREGHAHSLVGLCLTDLGRTSQALQHVRLASELHVRAGNLTGQAAALMMLGRLQIAAGQPARGCESCRQAAQLYAGLNDRDGLAMAANHIADALADQRDFAAAIASYRQAARWFRLLGDSLGEVYCLFGIGRCHEAAGDLAAAADSWRAGLEVLGDADHPEAANVRAALAVLTAPAGPDPADRVPDSS
jgi:DNA-binding SARP family transcriptional activator